MARIQNSRVLPGAMEPPSEFQRQLDRQREARKTQALPRYRELVFAAAEGRALTPEEMDELDKLLSILELTRRDVDNDVAIISRRNFLEVDCVDIDAKISAAWERMCATTSEIQALAPKRVALQAEWARAEGEHAQLGKIKRERDSLASGCPRLWDRVTVAAPAPAKRRKTG